MRIVIVRLLPKGHRDDRLESRGDRPDGHRDNRPGGWRDDLLLYTVVATSVLMTVATTFYMVATTII